MASYFVLIAMARERIPLPVIMDIATYCRSFEKIMIEIQLDSSVASQNPCFISPYILLNLLETYACNFTTKSLLAVIGLLVFFNECFPLKKYETLLPLPPRTHARRIQIRTSLTKLSFFTYGSIKSIQITNQDGLPVCSHSHYSQ